MYLGFLFSIISSLLIFKFQDYEINIIINILVATSYYFFIGIVDDIFKIKPLIRLFLQFLGAIFICANIIKMDSIGINFIDQFPLICTLITIIWFVGITNAFNWIDGLDGLCSGISVIISLSTLFFGIINGSGIIILLSSSIIGCCLGFLKYNFYPSKLLMGDGGSYFLGISLSILTLICNQAPNLIITNIENLYIPILLCGLPIMDMIYVIFIRIFKGFSPLHPDKNHIHHRLLRHKLSHKEAVYSIYNLSNLFISIVALFNFGMLGLLWFIFSVFLSIKNFKKVSLEKYF